MLGLLKSHCWFAKQVERKFETLRAVEGPEQGSWCFFADLTNRGLITSVVQAMLVFVFISLSSGMQWRGPLLLNMGPAQYSHVWPCLKCPWPRKQPTFHDATTGFPVKWRLRYECRISILMTCHYSDLGSTSGWLRQISHLARPVRSTIQIWLVVRHQYGISAIISQTSFRNKQVVVQLAKKVVSDSPGLVDFAFRLLIFVLNFSDGQVVLFGEI